MYEEKYGLETIHMALRNLVIEGDPLLRKTSRPVDEISPRIIKLLDDMADTMYYENRGIGIAAPQVGVLRRVFIVDVGDDLSHARRHFVAAVAAVEQPQLMVGGSQLSGDGTADGARPTDKKDSHDILCFR